MAQKESEQIPQRAEEKLSQPSELPEAWRRFYEEVRKVFVENNDGKGSGM